MSSLSIVLATYNEENNLPDCLQSVHQLADEIIVVDGSSKDKTVEIARKNGAKVIITDNKPIFHINKQIAIDNASRDWVLQLDADEQISKDLAEEIKSVINSESDINGYWIPRKNFFLDRFLKKGGQYPDYTLRLYKNGKGRLPCKSIHEQARVEGKTAYLKNDLLHFADRNFSRYLQRWVNTYTEREADEIEKKNPGFSFLQIINYFLIKPKIEFFKIFFRHRGYVDGFAGFVFAFFSALRFTVAYIKYRERKQGK